MNTAALAFRFRVVIFVLLYLLGFLPPWGAIVRGGNDGTLWLAVSTLAARSGWIGLAAATLTVTFIALACLAIGAVLRVWGTAYLGSGVMRGALMQGNRLVAAGPYRYLRNPLYLGSWLFGLATSILMPPSGAAFFLLTFSLFMLFLISAEERFLTAQLGDVYQEYCRSVPRLWPGFGAGAAPSSGASPLATSCSCRNSSDRLHALLRDLRLALQRTHPDPVPPDLLRPVTDHPRVYQAAHSTGGRRRITTPISLRRARSKRRDLVGIFTSGAYRATAPGVAFPQGKPHFAEPDCAE